MLNQPERIIQPTNIHLPDKDGPLAWAEYPIVYCDWLKAVAPQFGDPQIARLIVLAQALDCFIGDDNNLFILGRSIPYTPEQGTLVLEQFRVRIRWEQSVPLLPKYMIDIMGRVKHLLPSFDWTTEAGYNQAVETRKPLVERAQRLIRVKNDICRRAIKTSAQDKSLFQPAWKEFFAQNS